MPYAIDVKGVSRRYVFPDTVDRDAALGMVQDKERELLPQDLFPSESGQLPSLANDFTTGGARPALQVPQNIGATPAIAESVQQGIAQVTPIPGKIEQDPRTGIYSVPQEPEPTTSQVILAPIGETLSAAGKALKASLFDAWSTIKGKPSEGGNLYAMAQGEPMPTDIANAADKGWAAVPAQIVGGLAESAPKIAAVMATGPGGLLAQVLMGGGLFGLDGEGNFHSKDAAFGAIMPGVGHMARKATAESLGYLLKGAPPNTVSPVAQKVIETVADQAALDVWAAAQNSGELTKLWYEDPEEFKREGARIIGGMLPFALFSAPNFRGKVPSQTQTVLDAYAQRAASKLPNTPAPAPARPILQSQQSVTDAQIAAKRGTPYTPPPRRGQESEVRSQESEGARAPSILTPESEAAGPVTIGDARRLELVRRIGSFEDIPGGMVQPGEEGLLAATHQFDPAANAWRYRKPGEMPSTPPESILNPESRIPNPPPEISRPEATIVERPAGKPPVSPMPERPVTPPPAIAPGPTVKPPDSQAGGESLPPRQPPERVGAETVEPAQPPAAPANPVIHIASWVSQNLQSGTQFNSRELFDRANEAYGGTQAQGKYTVKDAYDAMEAGVNRFLQSNPDHFNPSARTREHAETILSDLKAAMERLPTQTARTAEMDKLQQFSTPPPLSFVANWVADIRPGETMLEPSGGVGGIAVFAKNAGAKVIVNELSPRRRAVLEQTGIADQIFGENAEHLDALFKPKIASGEIKQPTVVVMNPPFSNAAKSGAAGKSIIGLQHVEEALKLLPVGGRLVAVLGEGAALDKPAMRPFWDKIARNRNYNIRANVGVSGEEYRKYGTTFGNQLVVIDKTPGQFKSWSDVVTGKVDKVEDLIYLLEGIRNDRARIEPTPVEPGGAAPAPPGSSQPRPAAVRPAGPVPGQPGGQPRPTGGRDPGLRPQPGSANVRPPQAGGGTGTGGSGQTPSQPTAGPGGPPVAEGTAGQVRLESGRVVALPDLRKATSDRATTKQLRELDAWLHQTALEDATATGKDYQTVIFRGMNPDRLSPADRDILNDYLFGNEKGISLVTGERVEPPPAAKLEPPLPPPPLEVEAKNEGLTVQQLKAGQKQLEDAGLFAKYRPAKVHVEGAKPHPTALVESTAMAAVDPPDPIYSPHLPPELIKSGGLSDAQLENVIYAGQAHAKTLPTGERMGYFIGDGTGVGKGREISGIIMDNWNQGRRKAVWVSKNKDLINDAARDLGDIGMDPKLILNAAKNAKVLSEAGDGVAFLTYTGLAKGNPRIKPESVGVHAREGRLKPELNPTGDPQKPPRMKRLYDWLGPDFDGVIAFDEVHLAGNAIDLPGKRGVQEASQTGLAVVDLQTLFPKARIVYVSATGATDVTNLSYADRLGIWGHGTPFPDKRTFFGEVQRGGLSAMEIVARDLKSMGRYLARTLDFEGVEQEQLVHNLTPAQVKYYDVAAKAWQEVLTRLDDIMAQTGANNNGQARGRAIGKFWGQQQRFFQQLLTAAQMPTVLADAKKQLARGKSVVMQIVNTNAATLERELSRLAKEGEEADVETIDLSPSEIILRYIDAIPTNKFEPVEDANGNVRWVEMTVKDANGNDVFVQDPEAVAAKQALMDRIKLDMREMPSNPMEMVLNTFGEENVAEVTGRSRRVVQKLQPDGTRKAEVERRSVPIRLADAKEFNDKKRRVLIFSDAGGTGVSYHASRKVKNQEQRMHYLVQAGWRAAQAVQGMGRTHRSDQAAAPFYKLVSTDLKGHQRFISTIARRLNELGALTSGERKAAERGLFDETSNLENDYAEDAVEQLWRDLHGGRVEGFDFNDMSRKFGFMRKTFDPKTGEFNEINTLISRDGSLNVTKLPTIQQFLNRILLLEANPQNVIFDRFFERMQTRIENAKAMGDFDPGTQTLKALSIKKVADDVVYEHPDSTATTRLAVVEHEQPTTRIAWGEIAKIQPRDEIRGFAKNNKSGRVFAFKDGVMRTQENGEVVQTFRRIWPTGNDIVPRGDLSRDNFTKLDAEQAKLAWDAQYAEAPKTRTERDTYVVGAFLPIWDRLKLPSPKVWKITTTDTKETFLGAHVPARQVDALRARLGAGGDKITPEQAFADVLQNGREIELANGWKLRRTFRSGENRIEVRGVKMDQQREFEDFLGGYMERINWEPRFFLPTDQAAGIESMRKVLDKAPPITPELPGPEAGVSSGAGMPESLEQILSRKYKLIHQNGMVDGREVINADRVPNTASIGSSFEEYRVLPGIREVPMSDFELTGRSYSLEGNRRIEQLTAAIRESGQITPLIVAVDAQGPYILEGATRVDALYNLGAKSFPALVVIDRSPQGAGAPLARATLPVAMDRTEPGDTGVPEIMDSLVAVQRIAGGQAGDIRTGRIGRPGFAGWFKNHEEITRLKSYDDIPTAVHETAHGLAKQVFGTIGSSGMAGRLAPGVAAEFEALGKALYGTTKPAAGYRAEGWAEFLRHWLTTDDAASVAPKAAKWFEDVFLVDHFDVARQLQKTRQLITTYRNQGAVARAQSQIRREPGAMAKVFKALGEFVGYQAQMESFSPIEALARAAERKLGRKLSPSEDPFKLASWKRGTAGSTVERWTMNHMTDVWGNPVGPSLSEALAPVKGKRNEFLLYLFARRALERWGNGKNPGITAADAAHIKNLYDSPEFQLAAQKYYQWWDGVLNYAVQADPSMADMVARIKQGSSDYAPLARLIDPSRAKTVAANARANPLMRQWGSGLPVKDIFEQTFINAARIVNRANRGLVANAIVKLANVEGMGRVIERVPLSKVKESVSIERVRAQLEDLGVDTQSIPVDTLLEWWTPADRPKGSDPIIRASLPGGGKAWYWVEPKIYDTLDGLQTFSLKESFPGVPGLGRVLDLVLGAPARAFRLGTTGLRPAFSLVTNPVRDIATLLVQSNTRNPARLALSYPAAVAGVLREGITGKEGAYVRAFYNLGAHMGQPLGLDLTHTRRVSNELFHGRILRTVLNPVDHLRQLLSIPEAAPRVAELRAIAQEIGWKPGTPMLPDQAVQLALASKRATVDFSAAGNVSRILNQAVPFYNPAIQGLRSFGRAFKEHPLRTTLLGLAFFAGPTLALWWQNKDKEWYRALPWRERYLYTHLDDGQTVWRIPRPFEWGMAFMAWPEALFDSWFMRDPEAVKRALGVAFDVVNPLDYPVLLKAAKEQWSNRVSFWDKPIVPESEIGLPANEQSGPYTSKLARFLGSVLPGVSPRRVDAFIRSYFGGAGTDALQLLGLGSTRKERDFEMADLPVFGVAAMRGGHFNESNQHIADFYDAYTTDRARVDAFNYAKKPAILGERALPELSPVTMARAAVASKYSQAISMLLLLARNTKESAAREKLYMEAGRTAQQGLKIIRPKETK